MPRGQQFLSSLVNGLLQVPSPELAGTEQSYLPPDLRSLLGAGLRRAAWRRST